MGASSCCGRTMGSTKTLPSKGLMLKTLSRWPGPYPPLVLSGALPFPGRQFQCSRCNDQRFRAPRSPFC